MGKGLDDAELRSKLHDEWEVVEPPPLTAEELERIRQEPDFSTAEVLERLNAIDGL